jgi:hypothetical protein
VAAIAGTITCRRSSGSVADGLRLPAGTGTGTGRDRDRDGRKASGPEELGYVLEGAGTGQVDGVLAAVVQPVGGDLGDL